MKILQINKFLYRRGGTETYLLNLVKLLKKHKQKVFYFSQKNPNNLKTNDEQYFIDDLELGKFSFASLIKLPRIFWSFKAQKLVEENIKNNKPEIVHLHNIYHQLSPSILPILKKYNLPVVMTVHDMKLITPDYTLRADNKVTCHKNSFLIDLLLRLEFSFHRWLKVYKNNIDLFIVPSEFVKKELLKQGFDKKKITVIPHFLPDNNDQPKKKNNVTEKYLLAYGRLDESKGFDDLIKAFAELPIAGLKLKIAGDGPQKNELKRLIKKLGQEKRIALIGKKEPQELAELIENSLFIVNSSKVHETFGLTVLEAMALGKTVIASRVGAIEELIESDKNGLLYNAGDIGDLKEQLLKLLIDESLIKKLGHNAKLKAREFSEDRHYQSLMKAYEQAIRNNKKPFKLINDNLINLILFLSISALLLIPFYQINIDRSRAMLVASHSYPRLANLYWRNPITPDVARQLAKWDLLALDMTAQVYSADAIEMIREINPEIIILAYTTANEMPVGRLNDVEPRGYGLWHEIAKGNKPEWQLKTIKGENVVFWQGNILMNKSAKDKNGKTYGDYLVDFYADKILSTGLWDGLIFDNTWANVSWINPEIDIDNDGQKDSETKINETWRASQQEFFRKLRERVGDNYLIVGNGDAELIEINNGRMFEGFPEYWEGGWTGQAKKMAVVSVDGLAPRVNIVNSDSDNTGNSSDYRAMRFGLMSALLFDGYYSFDYGPNLREHLWWYDEYEIDLGRPLAPAFNHLKKEDQNFSPGLWQRSYENGLVLLNSTDRYTTIYFSNKYRKLSGSQDPTTNSGELSSSFRIPPQDGIIILREQK